MIERLIELISFLRSNQNSNTMIKKATSKQTDEQDWSRSSINRSWWHLSKVLCEDCKTERKFLQLTRNCRVNHERRILASTFKFLLVAKVHLSLSIIDQHFSTCCQVSSAKDYNYDRTTSVYHEYIKKNWHWGWQQALQYLYHWHTLLCLLHWLSMSFWTSQWKAWQHIIVQDSLSRY